MSSSNKKSIRKKYSQGSKISENEPVYVKHRLAKVRKLQKTINSICDNDSSSPEDTKPFFLRTVNSHKANSKELSSNEDSVDKSSEEDTINKTKQKRGSTSSTTAEEGQNDCDKQEMNKKYATVDKHKNNMKSKKVDPSNIRKEKNKDNRKSDIEDSEEEVNEKSAMRKEKNLLILKSKQKELLELNKEDADSSSGKEFQKSKISHCGSNIIKKLTQSREEQVLSTNLISKSSTQLTKKIVVSKEQRLQYMSHALKIYNKFKEACSEYELQMDHIKWKHLKKDLIYLESASNISQKLKNIINGLRMKLDAQENEITSFYEEWEKKSMLDTTDHEESSLSESEVLKNTQNNESLSKSGNSSKATSIVSECDHEKIFSDNETTVDNNQRNKDSIVAEILEKLVNNDSENNNRSTSPILGSYKQKRKFNKTDTEDTSKASDENKKMCKEQTSINQHITNESIDDIFEESIIDNIDATDNLKEGRDELENENNLQSKKIAGNNVNKDDTSSSKTEFTDKDSCLTKPKDIELKSITSSEISKPIRKEKNNDSDEFDDEEQAKKAMLTSDSATPEKEESLFEKLIEESSMDNSIKQKDILQINTIKANKKERKSKVQDNSIHEDTLFEEQDEIIKVEACAKRTLLESNSDDSMSPCDIQKSSNKKHDSVDNSEDSSSDSDSKLKAIKTNFSSRENKEKVETSSKPLNSKQRVYLPSVNYTGSDKKLKMLPEVIVERLPEKILKKYKNALQKSQQYLENIVIKSLIDLDRLQKNYKSTNDLSRSPLLKTVKKMKVKEVEDSLLDHLKKVEDGIFIENAEEDLNTVNDSTIEKTQANIETNEELMIEADAATKNVLLCSSDSDIVAPENNDSEEEKNKIKSKDHLKKSNQKEENKDNDEENDEEREKNKWRRDKLLTTKFSSDSDSDTTREKWNKKQKEMAEKTEESHTENLATKEAIKRKRRCRRKIMDSDSDKMFSSNSDSNNSDALEGNKSSDTDSSIGKPKKMRKRKTRKSSDTDSSFAEKRVKPKRRRIKNMSSDSDDSSDNDQNTSQGTPGKKGRKNIRKVMKDKQVADDTKQAAKEEEERIKRIAERQKLYNEMYEARLAGEEKVEKLVLDFDPETKKELVTVHQDLVKRLKPHQAKGIKFMWDASFESLERVKSSTGSGCIIAHCMGLGKTLQVIALVHTLLTHEEIGVRTVMIVCPLSTVLNWLNEFNLWLKDITDDIEVYEMTKLKKNNERKFQLERWQKTGGILIIGYEMFRNLSGTNNRMRKNMKEAILQYLIDPGPDVIVCDEGHLLKNEDTALSKSIKRIKTLRRIVLTGTPLQNNLIEYHCMVQFVKPNLLGTKKEFLNRFANPITNGQFEDSTEYDVKIMKKRAYILHKMLKGCVQRFDYSVLTPFLPPKQEYVIFVSLTEVQIKMYQHYLDNFARRMRNASGSIFADFQALQRIWTHPVVLRLNAEKIEKMNEKKLDSSDSEGSLKDFIDDNDTETTTSSSSTDDDDDEVISVDSNGTSKKIDIVQKLDEPEKKEEEWWLQFVQPEHFEDIRVSSKLVLLFSILRECEQIGDKVLVFSQSLYSLTLIEQFLEKIDNETQNGTISEYLDGHTGNWSPGLDYFRLDGQTPAEYRNMWCRKFNEPSNTRARLFLISTRAGGLGINLTAANRVIIFDASWNPSHDVQSIFRVYRFGQKKPCYVYRFLASGTMEEKIYNRQVTKLSLSCRVVDEQQIERHYSNNDLSELYNFEPSTNNGEKPTLNLPKDRLLAEIFSKYKDFVENYHEHDSLLENKAEEELNEEERKQAWLEYEEEKKGKPLVISGAIAPYPAMAQFPNQLMLNQYNIPSTFNISTDYDKLRELLQKDYPNATPETQQMMTTRVLTDMYSYWEQQAFHNSANRLMEQNPNVNPMQIRAQVPNLARMPYVVQNTNKNLTNQPKDYRTTDIRIADTDDDIVEVTSTTVSNKNKNQEE